MIERFVNRFVPAGSSKERLRARQLVLMCCGSAPLWCGFSLWLLLVAGSVAAFGATLAGGVLTCSIPWVLRRTGSVPIAGNLLAAICFVCLLCLAWLRGGFPTQVLVWNLVIPMYAMLLTQSRVNVAIWTLLVCAELAILLGLNLSGHAPPGVFEISDEHTMIATVLSLVALAVHLVVLATPIAESQNKLGAERDDLEQRLQQAQRLGSLGDLAGGIAHDFANVLTGMRGSMELMRHRLGNEHDVHGDLEAMAICIERGVGLTHRLLAFARRDESRPQALDVNRSIEETKTVLRRLLRADITVGTALSADLWTVKVDPLQLDRVMLNLAINARDAMPEGGELVFRTSNVELDRGSCREFVHLKRGRYVRIDVDDTGCGMPSDILERIFEPFFTTKGGGAGSGLGLASCFGVVRQAGGEIKVSSEVGKGTRFSVFLPVVQVEERKQPKPASRSHLLMFEDEESKGGFDEPTSERN